MSIYVCRFGGGGGGGGGGLLKGTSILHMYCRTQNVSGHFNLANYSESILSLTFSNANKNVLML